jgi:5'-deoxynucleotidase YfbR-like HD superfamily hydrolase
MDFEKMVFDVAPWSREFMVFLKAEEGGSLLRGRSGWLIRAVENPETIYEHMCKIGLASWHLFHTKETVEIGIAHELPELLGKDYLPGEIKPSTKHEIEYQNMIKLRGSLPNGEFWFDAWQRYENKIGIGSVIAELDKICPAIQAVDYIRTHNGHNLGEFYPHARKKINTPELVNLLDYICLTDVSQYESAYLPYFERLEKLQLFKK